MKRTVKICAQTLSVSCLFFGLLPILFYGIVHTGVVVLLLYGMVLLALTLLWDAFIGYGRVSHALREVADHRPLYIPRFWRWLRMLMAVGLVMVLAAGIAVSVPMINQAWGNRAHSGTAVVLGCQVRGEEPSLMLKRRIDAAAAYLKGNLEAVVCTGGRSEGEQISEAAVIRRELLECGITEDRIFLEEASGDTAENLRFAAQVIKEQKLNSDIAVATDGFHQLRAAVYAEKNGLHAAALSARTPWGLLPAYWVREWFALAEARCTLFWASDQT